MQYNKRIVKKIESYCFSKPGAYESGRLGIYPISYRIVGKSFAHFYRQEDFYKVTLGCRPEQAEIDRRLYPGVVVRGYHCPQRQHLHWNTIDLFAFDDDKRLYQMIDEAYDAIAEELTPKAKSQLLELARCEYVDTDGSNAEFAMLCSKLDQALDDLVGSKFQRSQYEQYNTREQIHDVIVIYRNGRPVACGGFKTYDQEHAELKRIFTDKSCRGIGLGEEIVRRLEAKAKMKGYIWCILETGKPLKAACHLYTKMGYEVIPNYGQYVDMPESICMRRKI